MNPVRKFIYKVKGNNSLEETSVLVLSNGVNADLQDFINYKDLKTPKENISLILVAKIICGYQRKSASSFLLPKWRNWETRWVQGPVSLRA